MRGIAASCLCWTEVWSRRFPLVSGKPASGIPEEPEVFLCPVGAHGRFGVAAGQAWGHAQQCSALLHSTVVGSPG